MRLEGFLPKGLFASLLGKIVDELQTVHGMSISDMVMSVSSISSAFGRHKFTLRELPDLQMMELLIKVKA